MRDPVFRSMQLADVRAKHIAPINALVDLLCDEQVGRWAPYVAPMYGGVDARLLAVLRDPGPKTNADHCGSGFLCWENDDATAGRIAAVFAGVGIRAGDVAPWNAYPWYINKLPTAAQLEAGVARRTTPAGRRSGILIRASASGARRIWRGPSSRRPICCGHPASTPDA
jgi:hypothetical protein